MVMADGKNKYNSRPILGKVHKRMKKIKVYDKVLKRNVTILVENDAEDNPLNPWNLDKAFINMIIADYVESTQWFRNRVEIQIVNVEQGTTGKNGTASNKKESTSNKKDSATGKKDYRNMVEIQIVNVEQGTKGKKESTSGKKESTTGKKDSSGKNGTIKKKDSTSGKKGSTEGKNGTATGKKDSSTDSA